MEKEQEKKGTSVHKIKLKTFCLFRGWYTLSTVFG